MGTRVGRTKGQFPEVWLARYEYRGKDSKTRCQWDCLNKYAGRFKARCVEAACLSFGCLPGPANQSNVLKVGRRDLVRHLESELEIGRS